MRIERTQRWRDRRYKMIPGDAEIDPATLSVDVIDRHLPVTDFIRTHHYAGTTPPIQLATGLYRNGKGGSSDLVGVCVFTVPMNYGSANKSAGIEDSRSVCDLGRLALLDDVGCNGETFLVSRAMKLLRREKPSIISVISYADPIRRLDADGNVVLPGHCGTLYAMMNARYVGRSSRRTDFIMPNGRLLSPRTRSKIRNDEEGRDGGIAQIVSAGAARPAPGQEARDWLDRLEAGGFLAKRRHPGNHTYVFPLTVAARIASKRIPSMPYPVIDRETADGDVTAMPLLMRAA